MTNLPGTEITITYHSTPARGEADVVLGQLGLLRECSREELLTKKIRVTGFDVVQRIVEAVLLYSLMPPVGVKQRPQEVVAFPRNMVVHPGHEVTQHAFELRGSHGFQVEARHGQVDALRKVAHQI